jgi:folylpolyglutamate synthase/dihydropteroate synthase
MKFLSTRLNVEAAAPSTIDVPRVFSLDRMHKLMSVLGDPHLACPVVHVAGSKGKGSVCEMIASGLRASGLGVGLYTSPHLQRINERIRVNDVEIEPAHLADAISKRPIEQLAKTVRQGVGGDCEGSLCQRHIKIRCDGFHQRIDDPCIRGDHECSGAED